MSGRGALPIEDQGAGIAQIFDDLTVVPTQFFRPEGRSAFRGERGLLAAILTDAVESYRKTEGSARPRDRTLHRETEEWIFSDDRSWWLSFVNICDALDVDPSEVRRAVRSREQRMTAGGRPAMEARLTR